ncbi:MAG: response regulator [Acidimicrobiia bacterium]|nr:response regulator [Acidimicrobiia bacterium]MBT8249016.1 response regulator [Acidimicrobiia bacterium]NNC42149.1 response regulator [Acidimicrobiia bacterium]NND13677.1 response regulator [Acidimicrobiia bacterium]NNL27188.1 response regulator [Acidimicrobiia bacterium]
MIAIIEDDRAIALTMELWVKRQGLDVVVVSDGALAVSSILQHQADLVLLDLALPGKTGWEILRELRSIEETRDLPIIVVTAHGDPTWRENAMARGATDFLTKPFKPRALVDLVVSLLPDEEDDASAVG